jgi:hypothetical protein
MTSQLCVKMPFTKPVLYSGMNVEKLSFSNISPISKKRGGSFSVGGGWSQGGGPSVDGRFTINW